MKIGPRFRRGPIGSPTSQRLSRPQINGPNHDPLDSDFSSESAGSPLPRSVQLAMRWAMLFGWGLPPVLFVLIVLLAPADVLDRWSGLTAACEAVRAVLLHLFPAFDFFRHARSTAFPQVATLATAFAAVAWVWMSGMTLTLALIGHAAMRRTAIGLGAKKLLWVCVMSPIFALGGMFVFFALPSDPSFAKGLTTSGRGGYTFIGTSMLLISSFGIGMWPLFIFALIFDVIFGGSRHG